MNWALRDKLEQWWVAGKVIGRFSRAGKACLMLGMHGDALGVGLSASKSALQCDINITDFRSTVFIRGENGGKLY